MHNTTLISPLFLSYYSDDFKESQWEMSYIIASQMLLQSITNKRLQTVYLCAQILIHCIAMYDRTISEQKITDDKKSTQLQNLLRESANETVRWLETYNGWDFEMKDILDVSLNF